MNNNQKQLVTKWSIGYLVVFILFAATYFLSDPMPIVFAIVMIFALFAGKKYKYDKERAEREMQEFIEYSKQHKGILMAVAAYTIVLPFVLLLLWKAHYISIGSMTKTPMLWAGLTFIPVFLFDLSHKVHIYKANGNLTEQGNQGDGE
ncbi:MAG: hypothetical protein ACYC69_05435 [Thermodesulfovibrionales bacterium]